MPYASINYTFTQRFAVPVERAFAWSTDYDPGPADWKRMGLEGSRRIRKLTEDAIILDDTRQTDRGRVTKRRLVRINRERRSLVNTHIGGPTPYSQFLYEFFPEPDGGSRLEFTGMLLLSVRKEVSPAEVARLAAAERAGDSKIWKNLAKAMEAELKEQAAH
ncbi:MAG: hypothetical protein JRN51_09825 [Nitrososphaerota archaeon]|nr:hypothetical protein [Nitrososphaerota archaeon]MDG6966251.1 hypothetical protein [Nitrososphaerota archaeon]MDG6977686.1 hypothetical protein [Nitrososphaerota archaeon]MDG6981391.1 hypothetical protein [Nitrososphaerota archaeon]